MKLPSYLVPLWAKWEAEPPGRMHSVICHLLDVMHVADELWRSALGDGLRQELAAGMKLPVDDARRWIAFWIGAHDLGKVSPVFQRQVTEAMPALRAAGFQFSATIEDSIPHGEVSAVELSRLLKSEHGLPKPVAKQIAHAVGGHHGRFIAAGRATKLGKLLETGSEVDLGDIGGGLWADARRDVLRVLASVANLPNGGKWDGLETQTSTNWLLTLAGLTTVADWMGSMTEYFEMAGPIEDLSEYIPRSRQRAERVVREVGWSGWQAPTVARSPEMLFPIVKRYGMRPLQIAVEDIKPALRQPSLVLIEAPMGEGKTEPRPSVSIVCLFASPEGLRLAAGGEVVDLKQKTDKPIDPRLTEAFIRRSVSIAHFGIVRELLADERRVPKAWRKNSLLRSLRVVEFDDGEFHATALAGWKRTLERVARAVVSEAITREDGSSRALKAHVAAERLFDRLLKKTLGN